MAEWPTEVLTAQIARQARYQRFELSYRSGFAPAANMLALADV